MTRPHSPPCASWQAPARSPFAGRGAYAIHALPVEAGPSADEPSVSPASVANPCDAQGAHHCARAVIDHDPRGWGYVGFCWDRSGLYFAGYFIWERTNYEPRGIERRPHQAKALGHLDLAIQFASPRTANSATAPGSAWPGRIF